MLYDAAGAPGMPGPQAFPQEGAYFTVPGRTCAAPTAMASQGPAQVLGRNLPTAGAMHPEGMKPSPTK